MEIKICGIRRDEDIEIVNRYRPEYVGFVFASSKRQVAPCDAARLSQMLDYGIKTVGVFVNAAYEEVRETVRIAGLDVVQLHGDETEEYIKNLDVDCEIWKAVRVKDGADILDVQGADKILLDKYKDSEYGGSGETFDWSASGAVHTKKPIILAGGLDSQNVAAGIRIFRPCCVDVSSSVETDGFKDEQKIKEFIHSVRNN